MKKRSVVFLVVGVGFILCSIGLVYALDKWKETQPTQENFDKAARAIWEKDHGLNTKDGFGENAYGVAPNRLCISLPDIVPDSRSKAQRPLAWYIDFSSDTVTSNERGKQLRQLNALAKVGLLKKSKEVVDFNGVMKDVTRYSLTEKGWAASGKDWRSTCFIFGELRYLGISRFEPKVIRNQAEPGLYEVHAKIGLSSTADLAPWAVDQELQAEFPEIKNNLDGQDVSMLLVRGDGGWVDYASRLQEEALKKANKSEGKGKAELPRITNEQKRDIDEQNALPPPTVDKIRTILQKSHGVGNESPEAIPCLNLPGSEYLPVDKVLFGDNPQHYSVAIFSNKVRATYDPVANKTIPYLNMLEQLGIVSKHLATGMSGMGKDAGNQFDGNIYELTPSYESRIHSQYTDCFPLGEPTVEFVDVQISNKTANGMPFSSFRYKLKVLYKSPPLWMTDPLLKSRWAELRGVLENGMACDGEFSFNGRNRDQISGTGACWWAFDSYYENY